MKRRFELIDILFCVLLALMTIALFMLADKANAQQVENVPLVLAHGRNAYSSDRTTVLVGFERNAAVPQPNHKLTPGAVDASLTAAKLCNANFHTGTVRNVTESTKKKVCAAYRETKGCPGAGFEIDHLISIELGGSNDITNLWPQPVDSANVIGFHTKDKLENQLHRMVCSGQITLPAAQKCIASDWYACMKKVGGN